MSAERRELRKLEKWERDLLGPLLQRQGRAKAKLAELQRLMAATQEELYTLELAMSGMAAALSGRADFERVELDLDGMILYELPDPTSAVQQAAAAAQALIDTHPPTQEDG